MGFAQRHVRLPFQGVIPYRWAKPIDSNTSKSPEEASSISPPLQKSPKNQGRGHAVYLEFIRPGRLGRPGLHHRLHRLLGAVALVFPKHRNGRPSLREPGQPRLNLVLYGTHRAIQAHGLPHHQTRTGFFGQEPVEGRVQSLAVYAFDWAGNHPQRIAHCQTTALGAKINRNPTSGANIQGS